MKDLRYVLGIVFILFALGLLSIRSPFAIFPAGAAVYVLGTVLRDKLR